MKKISSHNSKISYIGDIFLPILILVLLSSPHVVASIYNNFTSSTIEIVGNTGAYHFSPDTIFIHSKDTICWKNTCGNPVTVSSDNKTQHGNLDIGTLAAGEVSHPFTDFAEGTTSIYVKNHGKTCYGVIIVLPTPASAGPWQIFSKENIINHDSSLSMGDGPSDLVATPADSSFKPTLQFGGSIQVSSEILHKN